MWNCGSTLVGRKSQVTIAFIFNYYIFSDIILGISSLINLSNYYYMIGEDISVMTKCCVIAV